MVKIITIFTLVLQIFVYIITLYYFILGLFGLVKRKRKTKIQKKQQNRFAIVVAAHNEELVIEKLIGSLLEQNYPKELFDIFIVADNCTDNTAKLARNYNVNVYERFNNEKIGKGFALEWIFKKIFLRSNRYDTIAIFDADNLVSKNWLIEINNKMNCGFKIVQGYIDSKNPSDSWIATSYSIAFWTQNRLYQLARANLNLSNQIGGTGFAINIDTLMNIGWGAPSLTEDLEFSCKLLLNNEKIGWSHEAIIYDEKPLTLKQSWKQRKRWMQGFSDVASRYFFKLLKKGIFERKWHVIDSALYVIQPFITTLIGLSLILNILPTIFKFGLTIYSINYFIGDTIITIFAFSQLLTTPIVLKIDKNISKGMFIIMVSYSFSILLVPYLIRGYEGFLILSTTNIINCMLFYIITYLTLGKKEAILFCRFLLYALYNLTWIPISLQGILCKNKKVWVHTEHVRNLELCEI